MRKEVARDGKKRRRWEDKGAVGMCVEEEKEEQDREERKEG